MLLLGAILPFYPCNPFSALSVQLCRIDSDLLKSVSEGESMLNARHSAH